MIQSADNNDAHQSWEMYEGSENFNKETANTKMYQREVTEADEYKTALKNTLEVFTSRLDEAEKQISELEDRTWNSPNQNNKKKKELSKVSEDSLREPIGPQQE